MDKQYKKRIIEKEMEESLQVVGAINIVGPKYCGKTWISNKFAKSSYYIQDKKLENKNILLNNPEEILEGEKPRLIDEWQIIPDVWDSVRFWVDKKSEPGLYILTGSAFVNWENIMHSGAGRILEINMSTMTLYESEESNGKVSLIDLFNKKEIQPCSNKKNIKEIAFYAMRGGWPFTIQNPTFDYNKTLKTIYDSIFKGEHWIRDVPKRVNILKSVMKSLARNNTTQVQINTIVNDVNNDITRLTTKEYIEFLKNIHIIEELYVWNSYNFRSKTKLLTTPKLYMCDPSIGLYALGINGDKLFNDMNTFGMYFENLVIRDLRVYARAIDAELFFYRDKNGFEVDAIMELRDGSFAAFEIKLSDFNSNGESNVELAAKNLLKFKSKIEKQENLIFLAVITSSSFFHKREDGIYVIPIQCLKD